MKTVYKFLTLSVMMAAFVLANTSQSFAQDNPEKDDLYTKFTACYKDTDPAKRDACYAIAKQYLDKFGTIDDEYTTFVKKRYDAYAAAKKTSDLTKRFDDSIKNAQSVNVDDAYASGKEIIAASPDLIDVPIVLASIGFDNAAAKTPNDKYNNDAINYAKMAIQKIEAGKPSATGNFGAYAYAYKTDKFPDGKNNTLGWMNYTIGYIMFYRMNQKKDALPYLYKATTATSETRTNPEVYRTIGSWYVDEFIRLDADRVAKIKAAGDVDTDETKAILALQKGYADRAVEAYAKAYNIASNDPKDKAYKDSILNRVKELYAIRFNKDMTGFDAYMTSVKNKPFTDPTTAVVPVVEATPPPTATTTNNPAVSTTVTNTAAASDTTSRARTAGSTAATTTAKPAATSTTPTTADKKPAPKKKN